MSDAVDEYVCTVEEVNGVSEPVEGGLRIIITVVVSQQEASGARRHGSDDERERERPGG